MMTDILNKHGIRVMEYMITIGVIITLNFCLPRMMPGDPFLSLAGEDGMETGQYTEKERQYHMAWYGLDRPVHLQYVSYLKNLAMGNWGYSIHFNDHVASILLERLPWTLFLVLTAVVLSTVFGVLLGAVSAWYQGRWIDGGIYLSLILIAEIPAFLLGLMLLFIFAAGYGWFPLSGAMTHFAVYGSGLERLADICRHAVLPVMSLTIVRSSGIYLLARSSMISTIEKEYIRTATAKGLPRRQIITRHVMRNAMLPVVTRVFLTLGSLVGGAILVENVFTYPGLGRLMREAVLLHDYPLIQGIFLLVTGCVLTANFFADFLYVRIDPRVGKNQ